MLSRLFGAWNRRSLPVSWEGFHRIKCFYSQYGEDALLQAITQSRDKRGVYVDVGCFEPISLSNTYMLYRQGWHGIAIDPNADMAPLWKKHRPRDKFIGCAVGAQAGSMGYHKNHEFPNESHLDSTVATITVPVRRLDEILSTELPPRTTIDVMSVDCEGFDLSVLQSNDFHRFRPRVLIVEDSTHGNSELAEYVQSLDYTLTGMTVMSLLYVDNKTA